METKCEEREESSAPSGQGCWEGLGERWATTHGARTRAKGPVLGSWAVRDDLSPPHQVALGASVSSSIKWVTYLDWCEA